MMNRIVWHQTGGGYRPSAVDLRAYHGVIDGDGQVVPGIHPIEANAPGRLVAGRYAAHTLNLNSGAIGRAVGALAGAQWADPFGSTAAPVRPAQVDALVRDTADLCAAWGIRPERRTVLSHAEVPITLGVPQRQKWDFDYYPRTGRGPRDPVAIGDELRAEVARILAGQHIAPIPPPSPRPVLMQGAQGEHVRALQTALRITADGIFGPATRAAVVAFQRSRQLLPDGIVGRMTWAALNL